MYAYQTFTSGQILTDGQSQQIEDNIRDHVHGKSGVGPSGISWSVSSKGAAFSIVAADVGILHKCYGDFQVDFAAAASLGSNFGAGFKNMGSGRIVLAANGSQLIEGNSNFVLTPREMVTVHSDGTQLLCNGNTGGPVCLERVTVVGSLAQIDLNHIYPSDFLSYQLRVAAYQQSLGVVLLRWSQDSGSSFLTASYNDSDGDTAYIRLWRAATNSAQAILSLADFTNRANGVEVGFLINAARQSGAAFVSEVGFQGYNLAVGEINALRVLLSAGSFGSGTVVELWAAGRPR